MKEVEYVWMVEDHVRAELLTLGAFTSFVRYNLKGTIYETFVDNNEFEYLREDFDDDED